MSMDCQSRSLSICQDYDGLDFVASAGEDDWSGGSRNFDTLTVFVSYLLERPIGEETRRLYESIYVLRDHFSYRSEVL